MKVSLKFLTRSLPLQGYFFALPKLCLGIMGYWPESRTTCWHTLWAATNFVILFIGVVTEFMAGFAYMDDNLELALDALCPAGTSAITLLKMFLIYYYRQDLQLVLSRMRQLLYEGKMSSSKEQVIRKHSIMATRLGFPIFMMGLVTCTAYNLKPVIFAGFQWSQGKPVVWETSFHMAIPSFLLDAPYFPLSYLFIAYTGYITIFCFSGCDSFFFEFCAYITALFEVLQNDIHTIFKLYENRFTNSPAELMQSEQQLLNIIVRHNEIIDLTHYFIKRYTIITLAHFVSAGMVLGISIFDMMTFSGFRVLIYVSYTIAVLFQLFVYCYGGTLVAESSSHLSTVIYCCNWYNCDPKIRRMLLMMIIRSQRTLTMSVPFFSPSLATLTSILHTSGSIIALAKSFN